MTRLRANALPLDGMVFGKLTAIAPTEKRAPGNHFVLWRCRCECGNERVVASGMLMSGAATSCGCSNRVITHGASDTPEYKTWENMHQRCGNARHPQYPRYGARGITVCERWTTFEHFIADMGPRPDGLTLERIDGTKGYEPANCKWASTGEQNRNTSRNKWVTLNGETMCVTDWCKRAGITHNAYNGRLRLGWTLERIFTTPLTKRHGSTS